MTASPFGLEWFYAGERGAVDDVDVSWFESVALFNASASFRSVTVTARIPVDMAVASKRFPLNSGRGRLYRRGDMVLDAMWSDTTFEEPIDGWTTVAFTLSTRRDTDLGVWPNLRNWKPRFNPNELVGVPRLWFTGDDIPNKEERFGAFPGVSTDLQELQEVMAGWGGNARDYLSDKTTNVLLGDLFPNMPDTVVGEGLSYIFGEPGRVIREGANPLPGVPCHMVVGGPDFDPGDDPEYAFCVGHFETDTVTVHGLTATTPKSDRDFTSETVTAYKGETDNGIPYMYISGADFSAVESNSQITYPMQFYISMTDGPAHSGLAGDLLIEIYSASSLNVDYGSFQHAQTYLNTYRLDGYVDVPGPPSEFAAVSVLPLLPCTVLPGPRGERLTMYPWTDDGAGAGQGLHLVRGQDIDLAGPVSTLETEAAAEVSVTFARRADTGSSFAVQADGQGTSAGPSAHAKRGAVTVSADNCWDEQQAARIARDLLRFRNYSPRVIPYQVIDVGRLGLDGTDPLYVGRRVDITDTSLALDRERAIVGEVERNADRMLVRFYLEDPQVRWEV